MPVVVAPPTYIKPRPRGAKVLIIDDEEGIRNVLQRTLVAVGFEVIAAETGEEGTNVFRRERVDIVVVDMVLPKKDGVETIMDIRRGFPQAKFIAMSGEKNSEMLGLAEKVGAQKRLTKPFTRQQLIGAIEEVLRSGPPSDGAAA
jgi:DNA-binding NtrC family response regulator